MTGSAKEARMVRERDLGDEYLTGRRFQHQQDVEWLEGHTRVEKRLPYLQWKGFKEMLIT